jgi:hypothetical protein
MKGWGLVATMEKMRYTLIGFDGKPERKRLLPRSRIRWEDTITIFATRYFNHCCCVQLLRNLNASFKC